MNGGNNTRKQHEKVLLSNKKILKYSDYSTQKLTLANYEGGSKINTPTAQKNSPSRIGPIGKTHGGGSSAEEAAPVKDLG